MLFFSGTFSNEKRYFRLDFKLALGKKAKVNFPIFFKANVGGYGAFTVCSWPHLNHNV